MGIAIFLDKITSIHRKAPKALARFIKYCLVGITTSSLEIFLLFILVQFISIYYLIATALAGVLADSLGFALNFRWGFKETKTGKLRGYNFFILFSFVGLMLTLLLMKLFVDIIGIHYLLSRVIILCFTGLLTFSLNYLITFKMIHHLGDELRIN